MLVCILGLPGAGKTTLIRALAATFGAEVLHPGQYAKQRQLVASQHPSRAELLVVAGLTESILEYLAQRCDGLVLLDGFPRSRRQAATLLESELGELLVIHLVFPVEDAVRWSVQRQSQRIQSEGVVIPVARLEEQVELALQHDLAAIGELAAGGARILEIDARQSAVDVEKQAIAAISACLR